MKKFIAICFFLISVFILASPVSAEINAQTFSITPFLGGYTFEGNEDLKTRPVFGLRFGYDITERWGVEGILDYVKTESKAVSSDADVYGYRIEALYHFMPGNKFVPFLAMGLGGRSINYDQVLDDRNHALIDYGAGLKYFISDRMALRGDIRHLILRNDTSNNLEYTVGLTYYFGGPKRPVEVVVVDSDRDGVPDNLDKCPDTPAGVEVDQDGCPIVEKRQEAPAAVPRAVVEEQKKEAEAAAVVAKEMFEKGRATIDIKFDFDKANVKPEFHQEIKKFANVMKNYPQLKVVIEGHTDYIGGKAYNQRLSEKRANSVKTYLIEKFGIEGSRLATKGYGMSKPTASNRTVEGRQKNRRVEAAVDYTIEK